MWLKCLQSDRIQISSFPLWLTHMHTMIKIVVSFTPSPSLPAAPARWGGKCLIRDGSQGNGCEFRNLLPSRQRTGSVYGLRSAALSLRFWRMLTVSFHSKLSPHLYRPSLAIKLFCSRDMWVYSGSLIHAILYLPSSNMYTFVINAL